MEDEEPRCPVPELGQLCGQQLPDDLRPPASLEGAVHLPAGDMQGASAQALGVQQVEGCKKISLKEK